MTHIVDDTFTIQTKSSENGIWNTAILMKFPIQELYVDYGSSSLE